MKYLRIFKIFVSTSLANQMIYPSSFYFSIVGKIARVLLAVFLFDIIYGFTDTIAGWSKGEAMMVLATYLTIEFLIIVTVHRNLLYFLPAAIQRGTFDFWITKPVSTLFFAAARVFDFMDLISAASVVIVWWRALALLGINITAGQWFAWFMAIGAAYILVAALLVIIASTAFWSMTRVGAGRLFENMLSAGRVPTDVFSKPGRVLLSTIIPIAFIATVPSEILLQRVSVDTVLIGGVVEIVFVVLALYCWRVGLRHYSSASS